MRTAEIVVSETKKIIHSEEIKRRTVKEPDRHFTRNRKLSFVMLVSMILSHFQGTIQNALNHFPALVEAKISMYQSSFSQARAKINDTIFRELFEMTARTGYESRRSFKKAGGKLYHGNILVCAIDGSQAKVPNTPELREYFGTSGQGEKAPAARCSVLHDIQNDITLDAIMTPLSVGERSHALEMLKNRHIYKGVKELIIFDRGYYSGEFMENLLSSGYLFVFRMPIKRVAEVDAISKGIHTLRITLKDGKRARIRVVKFDLPSGETETLLTNYYKRTMTIEDYRALYFMRWPVEIKYDIVKNKIQLENFTGRTVEAISQDFYTCMYLANMIAIFKAEADPEIHEQRKDKDNKYEYQANTNEIVGSMRGRFIEACLEQSPAKSKHLIATIMFEIKRSVVPIRPDRVVPRSKTPRRMKHYHNKKCNA